MPGGYQYPGPQAPQAFFRNAIGATNATYAWI